MLADAVRYTVSRMHDGVNLVDDEARTGDSIAWSS